MNHDNLRRLLFGVLTLILLLVVGGAMAQSDEAQLRFVHAIPGAAAVDIYTDGQLTISGLDFGQASNFVNVPAATHQITVTQTGATTPLWEQAVTPGAGSALTLVAATTNPLQFSVYEDNLDPLRLGQARLTAIHAIDGGPAVDLVLTDGRVVIPDLEFNQPAGTLDVPAFLYDLVLVPSGEGVDKALTDPITSALASGTSYTLLIYGTSNSPQALWLTAPTSAEADSGFVRLVNGVEAWPAVDVYLNDTLVAPSLEFGGDTAQYIALPAGDYNVSLHSAGTDEAIAGADVSVESGSRVTAVALGSGDTVNLQVFQDAVNSVNETESVFRIINGISDDATISLQLADGTVLVDNVAAGESSDAIVEPSTEGVKAVVTSGDTTSEFDLIDRLYGGVYYSALAVGGDNLQVMLLSPVSLAQGVASAPGATSIAAEPPQAATEEPTEVAQETSSEVVQSTSSEVVQAPTQQSEVVPAVATPALSAPAGPTARVILDPGANLQLREYPRSDARSLGLAPSGTVLLVNGRAGEPALPEGATPDPNATPFVDPATLLSEDEDLAPENTWLNVTFNTPDGGAIDAWINSLYIDLRDEDGQRMRLADLPTVPENQPGEARNTDITPPPVRQNRVTVRVFNLDTGVNLNIRRTQGTSGEVLERVGNGTVMDFLGISESNDWVFVSYAPPTGGTVTGWVNATYVELLYNDQPITLDEIEARNLLVITPDDERGEVRGEVEGVLLPTVDPLKDAIVAEVTIDPGANLHLRRTPDSNGESLALIPSATLLIVTGRTEQSDWLRVEFEGQEGWIASAYVRLTFNGTPFELANVPLVETAPQATATPAA